MGGTRRSRRLLALGLFLVAASAPAAAHNGATASVHPVAGIVIDGSLSDWPAEVPALPLAWTAYGRPPKGPEDLRASLRVALSPDRSALLVALEVADDSSVIDHGPHADWDTQDGAEVFVSWADSLAVVQSSVYGVTATGHAGAVRHAHGRHTYEWRLAAPVQLPNHSVIGFDAAVCDRDADGSFTWQAWGRGEQKRDVAGRTGDLLVVDGDRLQTLSGQVVNASGAQLEAVPVAIDGRGFQLTARSADDGRFAVAVPSGRYRVYTSRQASDTVCVALGPAGARVRVEVADRPPAGRSWVPQRRLTTAGAGRVVGPWTRWGLLDGLPAGRVNDVLPDDDGNLWLATLKGLVRFDGARFELVELAGPDRPGLQALLRDRRRRLWLGTGQVSRAGLGAVLYDGQRLTAYGVDDGLAHGSVLSLLQDRRGDLWFGTYAGLTRFDGRRMRTYTVEDGLGDNTVMALAADASGVLWAGTGYGRSGGVAGGLSRFDGRRFTTLTTDDGLPSNWVSALHAGDGVLWVGTLGGGAARFDGTGFEVLDVDDGLPSNRVWAIDELADGTLVFGTARGLAFYDGDSVRTAARTSGFGEKDVVALRVEGRRLWLSSGHSAFGRRDGGHVQILHPEAGPMYAIADLGDLYLLGEKGILRVDDGRPVPYGGPSWPGPYRLLRDRRFRLWVASGAGLWRRDRASWTEVVSTAVLSGWTVTSLFEDAADRIWLGTRKGAYYVDDSGLHALVPADGLPQERVLGFADDGEGGVLIGTSGRLGRWHPTQQPPVVAMLGRPTVPLLTDTSGRAWIQVPEGVGIYRAGNLEVLTRADGLPHSQVNLACEAADGTVWLGTNGGVARFDDDGLSDLRAVGDPGVAIVAARQVGGQMWFGTSGMGVLRFDGEVLQQLLTSDGLASNQVYDLAAGADGDVWVVTEGGVTRYRPRPGTPRVVLDEVVAARLLGALSRVQLSSDQGHLSFSFHGSSLTTAPGAMRFRYRLFPQQSDWRVTARPQVSFEKLASGHYAFQLVAVDRDFGRSAPLVVEVDVHPPYAAWALRGLLAAAVLLLALQGRRLIQRDRRLRATNLQLSQANRELSSEVERRQQAEAERVALGLQVGELQYLNHLHGILDGPVMTEEMLGTVGGALTDALGSVDGVRIELSCHDQRWSKAFGQQPLRHRYEAPLAWGERVHGHLIVETATPLSEGQRWALLEETAAQAARRLENRELTAQLLQSARLVSLGEMAAGVAHELNQPLAAIATVAGDIHLRLLEHRGIDDDELKGMMKELMALVQRMSTTIDHLRLFSRDSSSEPGIDLSVNEVVTSALHMMRAQLANRGIEVVVDLAPDPPAVMGHPFQLEQVLLNLLANARDAVDEGTARDGRSEKRIHICTRRAAPGWLQLEVQDNGVGVEEGSLGRLFEPFYTTKPAARGTGLGLSISYAIVRNHGGRIDCTSTPGEGATFRVRLPVTSGETPP